MVNHTEALTEAERAAAATEAVRYLLDGLPTRAIFDAMEQLRADAQGSEDRARLCKLRAVKVIQDAYAGR